ncbi:MAG: hypothetical protein ACWA49_17885 [Ruegeria sp.]
MNFKHLLMTTSIVAVAAIPAFAQSRPFSDVDLNGDAQLSLEELEAAFGRDGADAIMDRSDLDGSGSVSAAEIRNSQDNDGRDDSSDDRDDDESSDDDGEDDHGSDDGEDDHGGDDGENDGGRDDGESDDGGDDGESDDGESDD